MSTTDEPAAATAEDTAKPGPDEAAKPRTDDAAKPARVAQPTVVQGSEPEPAAPSSPPAEEAAKATLVTARPPDARLSEVETMVFVPSDASKARREFNRYGRIEFLRDQVKRITQVPAAPRRDGDKPAEGHPMLLGFVVTLALALAALGVWYLTMGRAR